MNCFQSPCTLSLAELRSLALGDEIGAAAVGAVYIRPVSDEAADCYRSWISAGKHADMDYLARHDEVRQNPAQLLEGAQSMIVCAFSYANYDEFSLPVALYARGRDYHDEVKRRLRLLAESISERYGGETRVCVDTVPLRERYWAAEAGVGFIGRNNCLIVPGYGSYVFIGTLLWTGRVKEESEPMIMGCGNCGLCSRACPTGALPHDGGCLDARRCLSYLTIEHRGEFPPGTDLHGQLYGCDWCQRVCPHNQNLSVTKISEFRPSSRLAGLRPEEISEMTQEQYSELFRGSAMKRCKLEGLKRNFCGCFPGHR